MKSIKQMSNKELKKELERIYQQIDDVDCFGVEDLIYRGLLECEAEERGMEIQTITRVV